MATLYEYYNTGDDGGTNINDAAKWMAQTFTPATAHKITSVKLKLYRVGSPGTITVSIKATDENGHPTGADLCSGTTDGDTLTDSSPGEWREITLGAGYDLSADTKYAIVVRAANANTDNRFYWRLNTTGSYAGGNTEYSSNSGSSWTTYADYDYMFEDWGEPVTAPTVTTQAVSSIGTTTATGNGNITDTGGEDASAWGTCLAVTANPDTGDTVDAGSGAGGTGAFTTSIDSLSTPAKYHVRAYATNTEGTSYGADVTFVTHVTTSTIVGVLPSASRVLAIDRDASSIIGVLATDSKSWGVIKPASVIIGVLASASRKLAITRSGSVIIGVKAIASRVLTSTRKATSLIGILATASRKLAITRKASAIIGVLASASKGFIKSASVIIGVVATASRKLAITRKASAIIGVKTTVSRIIKVARSASVIVGIVSTASKVRGIIRSAIVQIGVLASASRALALSRTSTAIVGVKTTASKVSGIIRSASVKIGVVATASGVLSRIRTAIARIGVVATTSKTRGYIRSASVVIGVVASVTFKLSRVLRIITAQGAIYRLKSVGGKIYRLIHKEG